MSRMFTCEKCGKTLTRHTRKTHDLKWCPAVQRVKSQRCSNAIEQCHNHFLLGPKNARQTTCSDHCWGKVYRANRSGRSGLSEAEKEELHMRPMERRMRTVEGAAALAQGEMITGERSFALWADLLGLTLDCCEE